MEKKKSNFKQAAKIALIQRKTIQLKVNNQLPSYLCYLILHLNKDSNESYVKLLCDLTDDYLRVKGYYKRHADKEHVANDTIKNCLIQGGF